MAGRTDKYNLQRLGAGDSLSDEGYKFGTQDREVIDRLLAIGAEEHHHNGEESSLTQPEDPLRTSLGTAGSLPAGTRIFYRWSLVDVNGFESAASAETYVDTPVAPSAPAPPAISLVAATAPENALPAGTYYYAISAYASTNTLETKASEPVWITVPAIGSYSIRLEMPPAASGYPYYNVYKRSPGGSEYGWATTASDNWTDTGTKEDCNRRLPSVSRIASNNSVTLYTPLGFSLPAGYTWKIYRTFNTGDYSATLLHHVVEETAEGSGVIVTQYRDTGAATFEGAPLDRSQGVGSPSKIQLTDAEEVQGLMPMGMTTHPYQFERFWPGKVFQTVGSMVWVCEFPEFRILSVRLALGFGYSPSEQDVIVDVNRVVVGATPMTETIFTNQLARPTIPVGEQIGARAVPDIVDLVQGDMLTIDIDQEGGGATPNDYDLTITIFGVAHGFDAVTSFTTGA